MPSFFSETYTVVDNPNGSAIWWHSAPLPDGTRIRGAHPDLDRQFKIWRGLEIDPAAMEGKRVLDIGANDGFFSLAAQACGARVTSLNNADWVTWPQNITWLAERWSVDLEIVTGDFRTFDFEQTFDIILFLGVIYHVENVFDCMKRLKSLLSPGGTILLETHLSPIRPGVPIWEAASDLFPTSAPQGAATIDLVGISNYLLPNVEAIEALAATYGLKAESLLENDYCREDSLRGLFRIKAD